MKYAQTLSLLLLGSTLTFASSLSVYQNKSIYTFSPQDGFIGLTKGVTGKCKGESVPIELLDTCPDSQRICKLYSEMKMLNSKTHANTINMRVLESLVSLPKPNTVDAKEMIDAARAIAKEETRLTLEKEQLAHKTKKLKKIFAKQARSTLPVGIAEPCTKELELTLPYGYISFSSEYEATLLPNNELKVTQKLSILNRSGIDIEADHAAFHYRSSNTYLRPVHFNPWIIGERKVYAPQKQLKRTMKMAANIEESGMGGDIVPVAPVPVQAQYEESREYSIKNLQLPSTGEARYVPVVEWKVPATCENELYPYRNIHAFEVCSFTPKFQIEQHQWKVKSTQRVINEKAVGEYDKSHYKLYTRQIEDIKVIRKKIVKKERTSGIFGSTVRKKDGFVLTLMNKSDKKIDLKVTERIPTSNTEKIKVKLLSVHSEKTVDYTLGKDGKIQMNITLQPHETRKIEILFEISYDKDLNVSY